MPFVTRIFPLLAVLLATMHVAAFGAENAPYMGYAIELRNCIKAGVLFNAPPPSTAVNPTARFLVRLHPNREIADVALIASSGNRAFDFAVAEGIKRCNPFPDPRSSNFPSRVEVVYRMYDAMPASVPEGEPLSERVIEGNAALFLKPSIFFKPEATLVQGKDGRWSEEGAVGDIRYSSTIQGAKFWAIPKRVSSLDVAQEDSGSNHRGPERRETRSDAVYQAPL